MSLHHSGRCLCGNVSYEVSGSPIIVAQCHCDECRRLSGTGHTIGAVFEAKNFTLNGKVGEHQYKSSKASLVTRSFCPDCGSPIFGRNTKMPDHVSIPLGTMEDASDLSVEVVVFERDRKHWDQLGEDVASFETQPNWKPGS